eukprot:scaffold79814_cov33-Cyclotella_meneghiniana.AAC.1
MTENSTAKNSVAMRRFLMVTCSGYQMERWRDHMKAGCWGLKMDASMGIPKQKDYITRGETDKPQIGQTQFSSVKLGHD